MSDAFIASYDSSGAYKWSFCKRDGDRSNSSLHAIIDEESNVYAFTDFRDSVNYDPNNINNFIYSKGTASEALLARYSDNGTLKWHHTFGDGLGDVQIFDADYANGYIYFLADIPSHRVDWDPGSANAISLPVGADLALVKMDTSGNYVWGRQIVNTGYSIPKLLINDFGEIVITGSFKGTSSFAPVGNQWTRTALGTEHEIFVMKCDTGLGYILKLATFPGQGRDIPVDLSVNKFGDVSISTLPVQ